MVRFEGSVCTAGRMLQLHRCSYSDYRTELCFVTRGNEKRDTVKIRAPSTRSKQTTCPAYNSTFIRYARLYVALGVCRSLSRVVPKFLRYTYFVIVERASMLDIPQPTGFDSRLRVRRTVFTKGFQEYVEGRDKAFFRTRDHFSDYAEAKARDPSRSKK